MSDNKRPGIRLAVLAAALALAAGCIIGLGLGLLAAGALQVYPWRTSNIQAEPLAPQPATDLTGIWQANPSMAAGWADRYHFYPSGAFHFYPNQMTCPAEKVELHGTWSLVGSQLTLTVTQQVVNSYQQAANGFCTLQGSRTEDLSAPLTMVYALVTQGTLPDYAYPSITLNGIPYWQFSTDPSRYGDEVFPE